MCGEKLIVRRVAYFVFGSPPRVRGEGSLSCFSWRVPRITPACAGRSASVGRFFPALRDHPRVCGEKTSPPFYQLFKSGSPPRVRGEVEA